MKLFFYLSHSLILAAVYPIGEKQGDDFLAMGRHLLNLVYTDIIKKKEIYYDLCLLEGMMLKAVLLFNTYRTTLPPKPSPKTVWDNVSKEGNVIYRFLSATNAQFLRIYL